MEVDQDYRASLPAFDIRDDIKHAYSSSKNYKVHLFSNHRQLLVSKREVILIQGNSLRKKLLFNEDIVCATYTTFGIEPTESEGRHNDALVVCLKKTAYISYFDGRSYTVSIPFPLKSAMPFEYGLILEKDQNEVSMSLIGTSKPLQLNSAKFLIMVDPIEEFRAVTSSSTTTISLYERLMSFPSSSLSKASLCTTFNPYDRLVSIYHIRSSSRGSRKPIMNPPSQLKKKVATLSTPNPSRLYEDDVMYVDNPNGNINTGNSISGSYQSLSINMEKKRTSTLLSDISSMARMGSESSFSDNANNNKINGFDFGAYKKDMILSKIETVQLSERFSRIDIKNLWYEDQEAIAIINLNEPITQIYVFKHMPSLVPRLQSKLRITCLHCIPFMSSTNEGYLILLKDSHTISIFNPFLDIESFEVDLAKTYPPIRRLLSSCENSVVLLAHSGESYILNLVLQPSCEMTRTCLKFVKYLAGSKVSETFNLLWCSALLLDEEKDDWKAFVLVLLSTIYPFGEFDSKISNSITDLLPKAKMLKELSKFNYSFSDLIPYITLSLHLFREELKLNILSQEKVELLGSLLAQLTTWMGWPDQWTKYYMIESETLDRKVKFLLVCILDSPPNIYRSLISVLNLNLDSFLRFSELVEEDETADRIVTPRIHSILKLYELMVSHHYAPQKLVQLMTELNVTLEELETYPIGAALPLKEALLECQENPNFRWNDESLRLIGRRDLSLFLDADISKLSRLIHKSGTLNTHGLPKDIGHILTSVSDENDSLAAWDDQSEADRISITKLIFDFDRRYYEITTLLHQTKVQSATLTTEENVSEYDLFLIQRELAALVALRTLTIPLGRAALFYGGRMPLLTEKFPIPKFNFSTLISPMKTNIILSKGSVKQSFLEWGYFHNGVSSGLSISPDSKGISGSWIIFNKPPELNPQHAGFLLGLGLNGHLKRLEEWHIYNYLGPKHPLTSVGLLIGMAASMRGLMDNKLTKVLSVHAVALLPQGANDLNVPTVVQTSGLIGIGLLYLETQHRRMSEILLSQMTSSVFQNDIEIIDEGYRLAAGIALGFVNLGKGEDLRGLHDTHVVDKLMTLAVSMRDLQPVQEFDKSEAGAILALCFIYLKTEDSAIASKLRIPDTMQLLDYIRPDLLFLRCLASNLIMWNSIGNSTEWVESQIPKTLSSNFSLSSIDFLDSDQASYFNVLGGLCMSIAIKYASTQDIKSRNTVLNFMDQVMNITRISAVNFDQKLAYESALNLLCLLGLCSSVIMSASGDLETFRRLRILQASTTKFMDYGKYMAINTALGFLFMGGGQFAFSSSNFSVACLLVSLYPVFPKENTENEVHLQALRHLWALSIEPRCLVIRDVNTLEPCKVPVAIGLKNGMVKEVYSPYLLPPLNEISVISTDSSDHFNVKIDFSLNSSNLETFKKTHTIYVYKRKNYELFKCTVSNLLKNENRKLQADNGEIELNEDLGKVFGLLFMKNISKFEKQTLLFLSSHLAYSEKIIAENNALSIFDIIDSMIELEQITASPMTIDNLWNLKLVFTYADNILNDDHHFISLSFIEMLKQKLWNIASS